MSEIEIFDRWALWVLLMQVLGFLSAWEGESRGLTPEFSKTSPRTSGHGRKKSEKRGNQEGKDSLKIKFLGRIFLAPESWDIGGPRRRDIPDKHFIKVAFACCFRQGEAGMSRDLGRDVPDFEKLYAEETLG